MRRRRPPKKAPLAKTPQEKCASIGCRNQKSKDGRGYWNKYCNTCRYRRFVEAHPATHVLSKLRDSARRRNIPFSLTVAQFEKFCAETGYLERRGKEGECWTIDRRDRDEGYHIWNIQPLSHELNSMQGSDNTPRELRLFVQAEAKKQEVLPILNDDGNPF